MAKTYYHPITIQKIDKVTERFTDLYNVHAAINKAQDDNEYLRGGVVQAKRKLVFEIRYFKDLEDIALHTQLYRIVCDGTVYNITSYDDYSFRHINVKLLGESVG